MNIETKFNVNEENGHVCLEEIITIYHNFDTLVFTQKSYGVDAKNKINDLYDRTKLAMFMVNE